MTLVTLKSCPFCGGEAEVERMGTPRQSMIIACLWCGCRLETGETRLDANSHWNKRYREEKRMSTRAIITIMEDDKEICCIYKHCDGYPEGLGVDLKEFLKNMRLVNGIGYPSEEGIKEANGMGCLAAQLVAYFKDGPGGIYIYPAGTKDVGEEYRYVISWGEGSNPKLECEQV